MKKHMIGPYTVEDDMLCRDSQRIMTPAMAVMYDGLNCFAHKIGGRNGVLNWHKTFSKLHPETAHELYIVVLEREKFRQTMRVQCLTQWSITRARGKPRTGLAKD